MDRESKGTIVAILRSAEADRVDNLERATLLLVRAVSHLATVMQDVSRAQSDPERYGGRDVGSSSHLSEAYDAIQEAVDILTEKGGRTHG